GRRRRHRGLCAALRRHRAYRRHPGRYRPRARRLAPGGPGRLSSHRSRAMAILLPAGLPARRKLRAEGVRPLRSDRLQGPPRPPLRICCVNLMPNKAATEAQLARLLGVGAIPVELVLGLPEGYRSRSTPADHLAFYRPWSSLGDVPLDALIVTGAPVEALPF